MKTIMRVMYPSQDSSYTRGGETRKSDKYSGKKKSNTLENVKFWLWNKVYMVSLLNKMLENTKPSVEKQCCHLHFLCEHKLKLITV